MSNVTNLRYTCVNDLVQKAKVNFTDKDPSSVSEKLSIIRQKSDQAKKQGDDEAAYIFLKMWLDSLKWLMRIRNKDGKLVYATSTTVNQIHEAKNKLADWKQKLEVRYELSSKKRINKVELMEIEMDESEASNIDISLRLSEIPTEDPLYISLCSDRGRFISCDQLYFLIQKIGLRYLIIDTRQKAYYESSRILSDKCINIPHCEIKRGTLGYQFQKCFKNDKYSYDLFMNRSAPCVDILILLDWNTTQETQPHTHINLLKNIFEKCDPGIRHENIKILNGGYQEWLKRFPVSSTNPDIEVPELENIEIDEIMFDLNDYPVWISDWDSHPEDEILKEDRIRKSKSKNKNSSIKNTDVETMDHQQQQPPQQHQQEQQQEQPPQQEPPHKRARHDVSPRKRGGKGARARTSDSHILPRSRDGLGIDSEIIEVSTLSSENQEERVTPIDCTVQQLQQHWQKMKQHQQLLEQREQQLQQREQQLQQREQQQLLLLELHQQKQQQESPHKRAPHNVSPRKRGGEGARARTSDSHILPRSQDGLGTDSEIIEVSTLSSENQEERVTSIYCTVDHQQQQQHSPQQQQPPQQQEPPQQQQPPQQHQQEQQQEPPHKRVPHNVRPRKRGGRGSRAKWLARREARRANERRSRL